MNTSPNTPKKRQSLESNEVFATPAAEDSETSLYYSFSLSEDDCSNNKENSLNLQRMKVTTPGTHVPKNHTSSLLRNVLKMNFTPCSENNKSVTLSHSSKPPKIPETLSSMDAIKPAYSENTNDMESVDENLPFENSDETASDVTDDFDNDMHNTIIENSVVVCINQNRTEKNESEAVAVMETSHEAKFQPKEPKLNTKSIGEILSITNIPQVPTNTRNVTKVIRQRMTHENRKTRYTEHTRRRSSTFELRKVDPRKSLEVLKQVEKRVSRSIAAVQGTGTSLKSNVTELALSSKTTKDVPKKPSANKPRMTISNQMPKIPIVSTRVHSNSNNILAQRRETKQSITKLAIASASSAKLSLAPIQDNFKKPVNCIVNRKISESSKCKYCDKTFVKSNAMESHLLDKCEKIPALVRRQLYQTLDSRGEAKSKQVARRTSHAFNQQENDSISKYSRFFLNLRNDAQDVAALDVEKGLKNLRAEIRKTKNGHTGIARTPIKTIPCHICKKKFLDCVEYADHITKHPNPN